MMGYQPTKGATMSTKPPAPIPQFNVCVDDEPSEQTLKVIEVCNEVIKKTDDETMTLGNVILWLWEQNQTLVRNLTRNANARKLIELEEQIEELEDENRDLKNELVLVKREEALFKSLSGVCKADNKRRDKDLELIEDIKAGKGIPLIISEERF